MRLSADQQEDCFENLVGDGGNDGALMPSSQAKYLELGLESTSRSTGHMHYNNCGMRKIGQFRS